MATIDGEGVQPGTETRPGPPAWVAQLVVPLGVGLALAALLTGFSLWFMDSKGLFDLDGSDNELKVLAAALGIVGTIITAGVTLIGTVVGFSIEHRTVALAEAEADRTAMLEADAARRNRIEIAIKAVEQLSDGPSAAAGDAAAPSNAPTRRGSGALLTVSALGEHALAVALLAEMWPRGLDASVAEQVLRGVFEGPDDEVDPDAQISAAALMSANAHALQESASTNHWPLRREGWPGRLPEHARLGLALAAANWIAHSFEHLRTAVCDGTWVLLDAVASPDEWSTTHEVATGALLAYAEILTVEGAAIDQGSEALEEIKRQLSEDAVPSGFHGVDVYRRIRQAHLDAGGTPLPAERRSDATSD